MGGLRRALVCLAALPFAGCTSMVPEPEIARPIPPAAPVEQAAPVEPAAPVDALAAGLAKGPRLKSSDMPTDDAGEALTAFITSCPRLLQRQDGSGLTRPGDWTDACTIASRWPYDKAGDFFQQYFETARIGDGQAYVTGYFEPELEGSRNRRADFQIPVYKLPADLVQAWPDNVPAAERTGPVPVMRRDAEGQLVPYFDRVAIEAGALAGEGLEIGWVADPAEYFFLQIQGSGRLRTPEGEIIRLGFAGSNGYPYTSIGALMRERDLLGTGPGQYAGSMQGILAYLRDHPEEGAQLMRENRRWIFFRELTGDGPLGALGVPVRALSSVAADPAFVPLGAPIFLKLDDARASGLWIAQDTGSAIKGANRFDSFWGAGEDAAVTAGGMAARGSALVLLPRGTLARHGVR